ncbi:MAG: esterase-like activity of phytase family protein [Pseudomonadota bacterium]
MATRTRTAWLVLASVALVACSHIGQQGGGHGEAATAHPAPARIGSLRLIGSTSLATGVLFEGVEFGGISGLDRAADGSYWALSDDRGGERGAPRFYNLRITHGPAGPLEVQVTRQVRLLRPDATPFPADARTVDPEAIRTAANGHLYWASEGIWHADPARRHPPFIREMDPSGAHLREFPLPAAYRQVDNATAGSRDNKGFEALAVTPDGTLYVANEDALIQDGPTTSLQHGSVVRVTALDPRTGAAGRQHAYALPPVPVDAAANAPFGPDNGLTELLAVDDSHFIAVERAFAFGVGNTIRLVLTGFDAQTTDVSQVAQLRPGGYRPMSRRLLLELPLRYQGLQIDNIEALSWGEPLPNGHRTLILAADNNFMPRTQSTQFLVFEVLP